MSAHAQDRPVWLITGCSTGIGREIARAALEAGERVALTARDAARVEGSGEAGAVRGRTGGV